MTQFTEQTKTPANMIDRMAGKYDGKELLPYRGRPGAMDAYKLPSLMHFGPVYRKDLEEICKLD
jgi:hypothetical protein